MKVQGRIAIGNFRCDSAEWPGSRLIDSLRMDGKSGADSARQRMIDRQEGRSLTDQVVVECMGGRDAAALQALEYRRLFDNIKAGRGTSGGGPMATAARRRLIERAARANISEGEHPDTGRDRANRKAYPAERGNSLAAAARDRMLDRKDGRATHTGEQPAEDRPIYGNDPARVWSNAGKF